MKEMFRLAAIVAVVEFVGGASSGSAAPSRRQVDFYLLDDGDGAEKEREIRWN